VRTRLFLLVLALFVCGAGTDAAQKKGRKPVTHTVTLDASSFSPANLTVARGDTVQWVNKDVIPHTATSTKAGVFDSGTIVTGKSWKNTFKAAGEFAYACQFHPTMKGTIVVK
jgi:plastocyanin